MTKVNVQLTSGKNVLALEVEDMLKDGNVAFFKVGIFKDMALILSGRSGTIKVNVTASEGWKNTGFDDTDWAITGHPDAYDAFLIDENDKLGAAKWVWPKVFYYRKVFTVVDGEIPTGTIVPARALRAPASKPVETSWFTLTGAKVNKNAISRGATGSVLLKRTVGVDGKVETTRSIAR